MARRKKSEKKTLTDMELRVMNIIWELGDVSVHDVLGELKKEEKFAYNTVSTVMRILEQKNVLSSRKEGRGHIYSAVLKKDAYESIGLSHIIENVFQGTPSALVKRLIDDENLSRAELNEIRALLNQKAAGEK